ncbi:hypothetical protein [Alicyclobacillus fastidiosus]|uniref:Uncharacterized protein n=1 Tax=Alicyclobacillus fastidiosus TaxID=392011 RepID=A0ABV5AB66_9BACL|nr:hypothetical protein [Alicyclobacillus fastidiosus]WEH10517.1 hypothetical protein PYS47_04635 [Alicyclobacillus fastidiosus]
MIDTELMSFLESFQSEMRQGFSRVDQRFSRLEGKVDLIYEELGAVKEQITVMEQAVVRLDKAADFTAEHTEQTRKGTLPVKKSEV